jgi:competence protein ComEC
VFLYGMLTGFSVSTERAVIMLFCMLFARLLGEAYDGQSAAGLAAIIILVMNPAEIYDSGFQLSFIAVFGIFAGNEIRRRLKIKSAVLIYLIPAISAQIATFPLILRSYYSFSPYTIIANIVLVPLMPVIVGSGFLAGILAACGMAFSSGALMTLAEISAGPAHYMLLGYEKVSLFLQNLPGADVVTGCPELWKCLVYYAGLFMMVYMSGRSFLLPQKVGNSTIYAIMFSITMVLILILLVFRPENSGLNVSFIDVGQGLSIYIEADGRHILADGGSSNVKSVGKYRIEPFLLWSGVREIDYCFVSHTDEDHISGIRELMEEGRIKIDTLVVGVNYEEDEPLIALAHEKGVKVIKVEAGDIINNNVDLFSDKVVDNSGDLSMRVLSPDSGFIYEDKNQASLVAEFEYGNLSMLFTGDSDMYAESEYVSHLSGDKINILQCPHHGSKYSSSELLLDTIRPDITVISCSKNNVYGHPARETLERLEAVGSRCYITSQDGMVTVKYDGDNTFTVDCYKISNRN